MPTFDKSWNQPPQDGLTDKVLHTLKKDPPLKPRIENTIRSLNRPISRLNDTSNKLNQKDNRLFDRIVQAQKNKDNQTSKALANELVQIRKTSKIVQGARTSLERTHLRLSTVSTLGDAIVTMKPAMNTMKAVVPAMNSIIPQASSELESMGNMLGEMMPGSISGDSFFVNEGMSSEETELILKEAAAVAQTKIDEKFPSIPSKNFNETSLFSGESS